LTQQIKEAYQISCRIRKGAKVSWIRNVIRTQLAEGNILDDMDVYHLSMKPKFEAFKYTKMKAYGNQLGLSKKTILHNGSL